MASSASTTAGFLLGLLSLLVLTACGTTSQQRVLYEASGIQVGIMTDGSTHEHGASPVRNRHPANLTPRDVRSLLGSLEISGWSGIVTGLFGTPQPKPVFTETELVELAEPLASAFHEATPRERVFFAIQNTDAPYETDRTSGSLFFRDEYLHVVLTDHAAFLQADPGGGETRDPRDTKGMKLWVVAPAQAATVPEQKEPHWTAFEKVRISLNPTEVLAGQRLPLPAAGSSRPQVAPPVAGQPATNTTESVNDLRLQIRELTNANLDLRSQQKEQATTIEKLQAEFERLRNEKNPGISKPSSGSKSSRKQTPP